MSALGTGAAYMSAEDQAAQRKKATMQAIEEEAGIQQKANTTTDEFVKENFDPTTRAANYEAQATKTEKSLGDLLSDQMSAGQGGVSPAAAGALSSAYTEGAGRATAAAGDKARTLSRLLGRGGAAGGLFGQDAERGADYASDMLGLGVDSRLNRNRANVAYGNAGNAGNDMALIGGLLSGGAGAAAGQYYSGTRTPQYNYRGADLPGSLRGGR